MTLEFHPVGVRCNLACGYCYQNPMRDAGNFGDGGYDWEKAKAALTAEGRKAFTIFGGEALLTPIDRLEEIWSWGLEQYGRNGIQTNATLITEAHFRLFSKYKVGVGVSMDGPDDLNDSRWNGSLEKTRASTAKSQANLERMIVGGTYLHGGGKPVPPSLIVTIYRKNAARENRIRFKAWLRHLSLLGLKHCRLHLLEVDNELVRSEWILDPMEAIEFFLEMAEFQSELAFEFDLFRDEKLLLLGDDGKATCIWNACDPFTTDAVRGVAADGTRLNCGRTNKEGIDFEKSATRGYERQLALYHTPMEFGGCQGCRFFIMCKGQCPGTAVDSDWRNRSEQCELLMATFEHFEIEMIQDGKRPLSIAAELPELERIMLEAWASGENPRIWAAVNQLKKGKKEPLVAGDHGDHYDGIRDPRQHADSDHGDYTDHGDSFTGASEHGDEHGDDHGDDFRHGDSDTETHGDSSKTTHGDYDDHGDQG